MPLPIGQTIKDRYRISRVISTQGGFGNTYLAYDNLLGQDIVIKESKTSADIEQDALLSELRILLNLDHPRLPKVYDGFFYERQLCVTMQYIPGRDVSSYLVLSNPERRAEPPDRPTALRWIVQTLEALAYLHSRGIVHRDVKPANLRVHTETGDIFLLDFGISQYIDRSLIRAHSPRFSPPEQHDPAGVTTPASDVYAVGATLYMLLTGREPPYRDDHYDKTLRLPTEENRTIPRELEHIVLKAMLYKPEDRFPNAQAMLEELQRLGYAPRPALPLSSVERRDVPPGAALEDGKHSLKTMATITLPDSDQVADTPAQKPGPAIGLPINTMIKNRYHIHELISERGGFGITYRATDIKRAEDVVIKLSRTAEVSTFDSLLAERELLRTLKHRSLPAVYDVFSYEFANEVLLCISMQYIRGRDVSTYLRDEPLDRRTAMNWMRQLLEALAYLHRRGIVHCDVKPSNLRISAETGELFLLDFGISQQNDEAAVRGFSQYYAAPEQFSRNGKITAATDVYAAGAILYIFLTGEHPPERTGQTQPILSLDRDRYAIPEGLERILRKALRTDPADRYPNAQAMLADLQRMPYARPAPSPILLWSLAGLVLVALLALTVTVGTLFSQRADPPLAMASPTTLPTIVAGTALPAVTVVVATVEAAPSPAVSPAPTVAPTVILADAAVLLAPAGRTQPSTVSSAPTAVATTTPVAVVRRIEVAGALVDALYVGKLPLQFTMFGEGLDTTGPLALQPKIAGQRAVNLKVLRAEEGRIELELTDLPQNFRSGEYELLINGQTTRTIVLRDYLREAHLQGIKPEYRYLAAIRPFPSYRFNNQDIAGPFALLYPQPDPALKGGYLRNGDLVEILDETANADFYLVRVRENFDPNLVGREGWVWAWIVEDNPPAPPEPGAIQMPYHIRGESRDQVIEWLVQRGVPAERIDSDFQTRERIPEVFDRFRPDDVVSAEPPEGAWIMPGSRVILGVRAP